ncbi:PLP-dependent aminotransferase family protein [Phyllobacterium phragmitis]|uniref:PLP-dependent aminotransferase family protein n=2 Tax=Phyllobacterium phragmitis TaxID=2670329 RepID=A0A2S9IRE0_9HYPH|nr:PLP-dependent aminotransferase family protein [Phyllobacterium phragmitis]
MFSWKPWTVEDSRLKYLGLVEALEADLRQGLVKPGDRLPPQRAIAEALGIDVTTVTRAFNEARRRGLVEANAGRGSFVRAAPEIAAASADRPVDLSMNIPPQPAGAALQRRIPEAIAGILSAPQGMLRLHYQQSEGSAPDRAAGAAWLAERLGSLAPDRVIVAGGAQSALFAICSALLKPGEALAAGRLTYPGFKAVAAQLNLPLVGLAIDENGIVPEDFERVCHERSPRALYVIPAIDNPTTATLPEGRRREIAEIARRHSVAIIEDDPYSCLREQVVPTFAEIAGDITWHIATLSKCLTPALRIAYTVAPDAGGAMRLAGILRATSLMAPPLMAALAARWIADGTAREVTDAVRHESAERQKLAATALGTATFFADPNGHHLWLKLPDHWRAEEFAAEADRSGIAIVPSGAFSISGDPERAVRVSLGVAPDRAALERGLTLLARLLERPSYAARVVV